MALRSENRFAVLASETPKGKVAKSAPKKEEKEVKVVKRKASNDPIQFRVTEETFKSGIKMLDEFGYGEEVKKFGYKVKLCRDVNCPSQAPLASQAPQAQAECEFWHRDQGDRRIDIGFFGYLPKEFLTLQNRPDEEPRWLEDDLPDLPDEVLITTILNVRWTQNLQKEKNLQMEQMTARRNRAAKSSRPLVDETPAGNTSYEENFPPLGV